MQLTYGCNKYACLLTWISNFGAALSLYWIKLFNIPILFFGMWIFSEWRSSLFYIYWNSTRVYFSNDSKKFNPRLNTQTLADLSIWPDTCAIPDPEAIWENVLSQENSLFISFTKKGFLLDQFFWWRTFVESILQGRFLTQPQLNTHILQWGENGLLVQKLKVDLSNRYRYKWKLHLDPSSWTP